METTMQAEENNVNASQHDKNNEPAQTESADSNAKNEDGEKEKEKILGVGKLTESEAKLCAKHFPKDCPRDRLRWLSFFPDVFFDYLASFYIFLNHTITLESLLILTNTAGATAFYLWYQTKESEFIAAKLDFSLVAVAVVFPLTFLLQQVFQRREAALQVFAEFRAILQNITFSFLNWNFSISVNGKGHFDGRRYLTVDFEERVVENCLKIARLLEKYLQEPEATRARHILVHRSKFCEGKMNEVRMHSKFLELLDNSYSFVEEMKIRGMPANEAARVNQYHWFLQARFERLRNFKWYRTPQPARSFGRLYILLIPWFYGPYYAWAAGLVVQVADDTNETETRTTGTTYAFAMVLSLFTIMVLLGLINASRRLEDPFSESGIDDIHVREDLRNLRTQLKEALGRLKRRRELPRFEFEYPQPE
eukprot:CAMPEP_0204826658 /NCGR_PEP_ID=MMETSP1346-20131115/4286_1 /ASSEMBLY_ACC=CAM_ASM_000771 /TAXON_ID=215587 /ORGANISM="Aplanochytrium stocchinoi, Strain GSBS06" /LENGTH=422 /DNA_ID=CAMNT_0051954763 /DNA_START=143 /DNA_END=1411 /DNA_ORIENTATION=-